ncbi:MAG: DNRLRE domain-containing protein [Candidatus Bathyarchaeia archaeon]
MKVYKSLKALSEILILILTVTVGQVACVGSETTATILKPIQDGYIDSMQPSVDFSGSNLYVEYYYSRPHSRQRWSFLLFDLATIPVQSKVESAELYVYAFDVHGTLRVGAYRSSDTYWSEKELYWTQARISSVSKRAADTKQVSSVAWCRFDVKSEVEESLPDRKLTIVLKPDYPEGFEYAASAAFYSSDQPGRFNSPRLEIVYTSPTQPKGKAILKLGVDPYRIQVGTDLTIFGSLKVDGTPLQQRLIKVEYSFEGLVWTLISNVETDLDGAFILKWKPEKEGHLKVRATFEGEGYTAEDSVNLEVEAKTSYPHLTTYIAAAATATSAAILLFILKILGRRRRRHRLLEEPKPATEGLVEAKERLEIIPAISTREFKIGVEPTYISTGHAGLDRLLRGGLHPSYAVVLTSPSCDEVDLLLHRFLESGLEAGHSALYITKRLSMELASKHPTRLYQVVCNPQVDAGSYKQPNIYTVKGLDNLTELNITVSRILESMGDGPGRVTCIDILSDILLQHGPASTRKWLLDYVSRMKSRFLTTIAILNSQMHPREELEALLDVFDGQIEIWEEKVDGEFRRYLRIKRMYNVDYIDETIPVMKADLKSMFRHHP